MRASCFAVECVGQSLTVVTAANERGEIVSAKRIPVGVSYHSTRRDRFRVFLFEAVHSLLDESKTAVSEAAKCNWAFGISGITFPFESRLAFNRSLRLSGLALASERYVCTGDAEVLVASTFLDGPACGIVCHAGSTAFVGLPAKEESRAFSVRRYGGWGPGLGDEGSGYWIGVQALRAIGRLYDEGTPMDQSILWQEVQRWLGDVNHVDDDIREGNLYWHEKFHDIVDAGLDPRTAAFGFYHKIGRLCYIERRRKILSNLVRPVMWAWERADQTADAIVRESINLLVAQLLRLLELTGFKAKPPPIVLYGGVFNHNPRFRAEVIRVLKENLSHADPLFLLPKDERVRRPVVGALMLALGGSAGSCLRMPDTSVCEVVCETAKHFNALNND